MLILFQPACFSSSVSSHSNVRKINSQFFATVFASFVPSCLCFSHPPSLCFFEDPDFFIKYPFILVKSHHSFPSIFLSGDFPWRCSIVLSLSSFILIFFSGGFNSSFGIEHTPFHFSQCFSYAGAPLNHPSLAIKLFRSAQDISKIRVFTLHSFKLFRDWYLIQVI